MQDSGAEYGDQDAGDQEPAHSGFQGGDQAAVVGDGAVEILGELADAGLAQGGLRRGEDVVDEAREEQEGAEHKGYDAGRLVSQHGHSPRLVAYPPMNSVRDPGLSLEPIVRIGGIAVPAPYADRVVQPQACLVDAYDTILTCDFSVLRGELSAMAGLSADVWAAEYDRLAPLLTDGRMTKAEGFAEILRARGREPSPRFVRALAVRDQELLLAHARLYSDSIPFLRKLRDRGVKIAIVSNCTESTRPLLARLGVDVLADAVVLSCEVGSAKPEAGIFRCALDRLGVSADAAVFVDDQAGYCAGAVAAGIGAAQIVRGTLDGNVPAAGTSVVRSLPEVEALLLG